MSKLTSLALGVVGAVIGFVVSGYNPYGAWIGFSIGMGIGTIIDPMTPDMPSPGEPMGELEVMTNIEGIPFPDVLGTTKMSGNLFYYGGNYRTEITEEVDGGGGSGGGGGDDEAVTGYRYYLSWAMGFCLGPIDTLYTVWADNDIVWSGAIPVSEATNGEVTIALGVGDRGEWPGDSQSSTGEFIGDTGLATGDQAADEGFMGLMTFYFGTEDQTIPNSQLTALMLSDGKIEDSTWALPYRRQVYAYMHNTHIGDYNRCPTIKIVVRKAPECSFDT